MAKVDLKKLEGLVDSYHLTVQEHPEADLLIFNYTAKAQYGQHWTRETLMSRGLITTKQGEIVARPFAKFFNLGETTETLPNEPFEVYEKLDGSLGILYWVGDEPRLATRGSFVSKQAIKATEILKEKYGKAKFDKNLTYLFEIIYPINRIVVDYGEMEELVLLAARDTETGKEIDLDEVDLPFPKVKLYKGIKALDELMGREEANKEGFVVKYESGLRVKIKFSEYVRLHKLVTGVTTKVIWELLKSGMGTQELLERVPDEFYDWVKRTEKDLTRSFDRIDEEVVRIVEEVKKLPNRRDQALKILKSGKHPKAVFAYLDGKDYRKIVWDVVKPNTTKPLVEEI